MIKDVLGEELRDYELDYKKIWFAPALMSPDLPHVQCLAVEEAWTGCQIAYNAVLKWLGI